MREARRAGVDHVWMHRGSGAGSVSQEATGTAGSTGRVIDGGCPLMFDPTADAGTRSCASPAWANAQGGLTSPLSRPDPG